MVGLTELDQIDYGVQFQRGQPSVTQVSGLAGLASPAANAIAGNTQNTLNDMRSLGAVNLKQPQAPAQPQGPVLAISRSTGKIWANGKLFTTDDAQGAIESEQFLGGAPAPAPAAEASDWEPLDQEAYAQHLQKIKDPSLTTLASKNFGIGIDNMQMLAGYGAQFLGAEEFGQGVVRQQLEDIRKNQPYQRSLEDIPERGAVEWLVANVAQQGPNLIESLVTAAAGAAVGAAAGGGPNPFTAVGGAMSAMVGKQAFKQAVMSAVQKQIRGEVLDAAEEKLLREATGMTLAATKTLADDVTNAYGGRAALTNIINKSAGARNQAMAGGAILGSTAQNYATGVSDLYGESVEGGQPDRLMAALGGVPYAAAETLPEYLAALRFFKGIGKKAMQAGSRAGRAGTVATNVGLGIGAGAVLEGSTEAFQETLGIGMNDAVDVDSPDGVSRLLNAFATGAAIGGMVGGLSSLNTGKATDLLSGGTKPAEQKGTTITQPETGGAYLGPLATPGTQPADTDTDTAEWQRLFGYTPATRMQTYPPPPPRYASPSETQPQGELFPNAPMGGAPAAVPTGPMQPPSGPSSVAQGDLFAPTRFSPLLALPPATTIYAGAPAPTQMLTGPQVAPPAPPPPDVINLPGPGTGSALQQAAEGTLTGGIPTGPIANRLQQQATAARARAQQEQAAAAEQARQAELQATSGSALARIGRGENVGAAPSVAPKVETVPIPYDTLSYDEKQKKAVASSGTSNVIDFGGRKMVVAVVNGVRVPFYLSTGSGGKKNVKAGRWYPFFGIGKGDGWINKTSEADINNYYGSPELRAIAEELDRTVGDVRKDSTIPKVKATGAHIDFINADMDPADNQQSDTLDKVRANIANTISRVRGETNATQEGVVARDNKLQRQQAAKRGQAAGAGGGNRPAKGRAGEAPIQEAQQQPGAEVTVTKTKRDLKRGVTIVTLSDGKEIPISKEKGGGSFFEGWYLEDVGGRPSEQMSRGYLGTTLEEAKAEIVKRANEGRLEQATAPAPEPEAPPKKETAAETDLQKFLRSYNEPGSSINNMRNNPDLTDYANYADWLASLSPNDLAKLDPVFTKNDNPFLFYFSGLDPVEARARLEAQLEPPPKKERQRAPKFNLKPKESIATDTDREMWDTYFDDGGVGYGKLSDAGKTAWRELVVRGDITQAEADALQARYAGAPSPKAQGAAAAPEQKAEPGTALALVDDKKTIFVDPEIEAYLLREQARASETGELSQQSEMDEVEDYILALDTFKPSDVEWKDAYDALSKSARGAGMATDANARKRARKYLEAMPKELRTIAERSVSNPVTQAELDLKIIVTTMEQINSGQIEFKNLGQSVIGGLVSAWKRIKSLDLMYGNIPLADYIKGGPQFFNMKDGKVVPKTPGRYSTTMWDVADKPMDTGRIKLKIGKLISGFARKPKVYVFRNQADLKASDPKLYARLAAGRPGDFDTVNAAGYSMGDTVVVFADRIGSEQHLSFVLAHETLGHFGLRGLMGGADFDRVMTGLYDTDSRLKAGVDARMAAFGTSKAEAVEEYLSDYAAQLHTSLVRRVWKGIKGALNRVGIRFGDEATRYLLSQAKRYVKTGEATGSFVTSSVAHRLWGVETGQVGRFSVVDMATTQTAFADTVRHGMPDLPKTREEFRDVLTNFSEYWDKFREQVFSLSNFQSLRNPGAYKFSQLMAKVVDDERYIFTKYNAKVENIVYKSEAHKNRVSQMLIEGRVVSVFRLLDNMLTTAERDLNLFRIGTFADDKKKGEVIADDAAIREAIDNGKVTADDVKRIKDKYQIAADRNEPMFEMQNGELVQRQPVVDRYLKRGILSFDEMKNGVEYSREFRTGVNKTVIEKQKFDGFKDLTQEQYDDYVLARTAIAEVELELLRAKYEAMLDNKRISDASISRFLKKNKITGEAASLVDKTMRKYGAIYTASYNIDDRGNITALSDNFKNADDFLVAVNRALISADAKNDDDVRNFLDQKEADDFMASLADFRSKRTMPDGDLKYLFQNEVKMVVLGDINLQTEEERAKRTMVGGYVPVIRNKAYQMLLQAYDSMGRKVKLHEDHRKLLVYSQFDTVANAKKTAEMYNKGLGDQTHEVLVQQDDGTYKLEAVRFKATYGEALQTTSTDPALNLEEFLHGVRLFNIQLTPNEMKEVITTMTESGNTLRNKLEFSATPGVDKNSGIYAMARYIQLRAGVIAKTKTRAQMRELMDRSNPESQKLWDGNREQVFSLYNRVQAATNPDLKAHYTQQLAHALHMFIETNPDAKGWDGSQAGYDKIKDNLERSNMNRFYNADQRKLELLDNNASAQETDFGNNRFVAGLRAFTSIAFLGLSLAQGVMNFASPYTNWIPYMASNNPRNGFGGGFSTGKVVAEYHRAMMQVGAKGLSPLKSGREYNTAEFYENAAKDKAKLDALGLTAEEAQFLSIEIREGKLQPAQTNALLGVARNGITNQYWLRALDIYMSPFNLSEQASRRAAGLAAFRLSMARLSTDPNLKAKEKFEIARNFAVQSLDLTLGEYSMMNRPPMWRGGLLGLLYMYKVYPTTVIQLFARLDRPRQLAMLGVMLALTGVAGLPFAEDLEDLIDTIAQMLGLQMPSVRAASAKMMDDLFPGLAPVVLKGVVNTMLGSPADLSSRFSLGDFVPGTGILLAGSKPEEELKDIAGPMPAFIFGAVTTARDLIAVPFSETKDFQSVLRASPITAGRMIGDAWAYVNNGAVVDRRGYVVSPDAHIGTVITRLLGFYPTAAADEYDAIRIAKRISNYQKDVVVAYRLAWIKADPAGRRQIERAVEEWNRGAKGTGLEIANFRKNSERALKESKLSATQRTLKSTGTAGREDITRITDLLIGE